MGLTLEAPVSKIKTQRGASPREWTPPGAPSAILHTTDAAARRACILDALGAKSQHLTSASVQQGLDRYDSAEETLEAFTSRDVRWPPKTTKTTALLAIATLRRWFHLDEAEVTL